MGHLTQKNLNNLLQEAKEKIEIGGIYFHHKRPKNYYLIEAVGFIESAEEICVVYRALYGKRIVWVRTLKNFLDEVNITGRKTKRFIKVA
ncbi:DUF1653 domain-containing protein [Candidatus Woesebacteria bacterium]|nr:DUF1653 domain-containing protein [Candidatus Woesebacteria bacterium]